MAKQSRNEKSRITSVQASVANLGKFDLTALELTESLDYIKKNPAETDKLGYGYLKDLARDYDPTSQKYTLSTGYNAVAKMIVDNIKQNSASEDAAQEKIMTLVQNIADGSMKSLSTEVPVFDFTIVNNIRNMTKYSPGKPMPQDCQRPYDGALLSLKERGLNETDASVFLKKILEKYPIIIGVIGISDTPKRLQQDACTVINNGSYNLSPSNYAQKYLEMQKFEKEVKQQVPGFVPDTKLEETVAKNFLKSKSLEGIEYVISNYKDGITLNQAPEAVASQLQLFESRKLDIENNSWGARLPSADASKNLNNEPVKTFNNTAEPENFWTKLSKAINQIIDKFKSYFAKKENNNFINSNLGDKSKQNSSSNAWTPGVASALKQNPPVQSHVEKVQIGNKDKSATERSK